MYQLVMPHNPSQRIREGLHAMTTRSTAVALCLRRLPAPRREMIAQRSQSPTPDRSSPVDDRDSLYRCKFRVCSKLLTFKVGHYNFQNRPLASKQASTGAFARV